MLRFISYRVTSYLLIAADPNIEIREHFYLLRSCPQQTHSLGDGVKVGTVLNKLKELKLKKTENSISMVNCRMILKQFGLDVILLLL